MTEEGRVAPQTFLQKNLMGIITAACMGYAGFITGQVTTNERLTTIERDADALGRRVDGLRSQVGSRSRPLACAVRTIDRLADKARIDPPCTLEVPE